ncbi:MAG: hypothetical protein QXG03_08270, partial [Halalkalicoccus sp.]
MDEAEPIRTDSEGVAVTKRYEPDDFAVPTISFEIRSSRSSPAKIRLEDRVPEGFPIEGIGFHPEYDSERWTAHEDRRLVFESEIEPETTVVTVYGIRIDDDEEAVAFMNEPVLSVDGREEPTSEPEAPAASVVTDGGGDAIPVPVSHVTTVGDSAPTEADSIAAALARELRSGSVSRADREALGKAFAAGGTEGESERIQIDHLQSRVSELEAYTEAFESFLDENGTGDRLVADLQGGLSELREDVEVMDTELDEAIERHEATIASLESDLADLDGAIGDRDDIAADIDAVSDDLDALYEDVDELRTWRDQLGMAFGS